jgi:hypothetical protein
LPVAVRPRDSRCCVELACDLKFQGITDLVHWVYDPIDAGIVANCLMLRIDQDYFKVLVGRVLVDPVRIQDTQVGTAATDTLLSGGLERALILELVDSLVGRFT